MLPATNDDIPFFPNIPTRFSHIISYVDFNQFSQEDDNHDENNNRVSSSFFTQRLIRQQTEPPRLVNSSFAVSSSLLKDTTINFANERGEEAKRAAKPIEEDIKEISVDSPPPVEFVETAERSQQTSPLEMPLVFEDELNDTTVVREPEPQPTNHHTPHQRNQSETRRSANNSVKRSSSEGRGSVLPGDDNEVEDEDDEEDEEEPTPNETKSMDTTTTTTAVKTDVLSVPLPSLGASPHRKKPNLTPTYYRKTPAFTSKSLVPKNSKSSSLKWSPSIDTPRSLALVPSMSRRAVQGVLVRFFRCGDEYHHGVKVAINEADLKSWEAFLNYLNRQPKLLPSTGGIRHVYSLTGQEIRSIKKFQHRQSYVVSSGGFSRTNFRYINEAFADETDSNFHQATPPYWNTRSSVYPRWRSPPTLIGEQIFVLPYSRLNTFESLFLNRYTTQTFEEWLQDQVSDLLSHYTNNDDITHIFGITKSAFIEVKSFSKLFHIVKMTDTFIGCTEEEYADARHYLTIMKPSELFLDRIAPPQKAIKGQHQPSKRVIEEAKLSLNWIHGYNGENDLTKTLHTLPENEILYVIGPVCIIYEPSLKQQRFYIEHSCTITYVNIHPCQSIIASSEIGSPKTNNRALIHIWDHVKLQTITEIRKEQFGSYLNLLSFSPKADDNLLLVVSRDKPEIVLFIDWKRNELIYSITCKSDHILSVLFVFDTTEWIACISEKHLLFYHVDWSLRPLRMLERREAEVQNVYTGAAACDTSGERLLVGDKVGSVHVWSLVNNEPRLVILQENILENDIETVIPVSQDAFILANGESQIKIWNINLNTVEQIRLNESIGPIRSICCIRRGTTVTTLAIGTKLNYIITKEMGSDRFDAIMRGHTSPAICLCCDKANQYFYSISSDRHLFKWNNRTKAVEWSAKSAQPISCADLHPERNIIVLGSETSKLLIYDTLSSYYIATITLKMNTGVKSVRFSPDGSNLAVGLQNGNVCIFDVLGNGEFNLPSDGILRNDTAPVNTVIWSTDSKYLLAIYNDNDYTIWTIPSFDIVRGKTIQTIDWHRVVHPIMCPMLDKASMDTHTSAIILTPSLALCCGKDGQLRLFRNRYERHCQSLQFGLGPIHTIIPSTTDQTYLLSMKDNPVIVEIQVNINSHSS